MIRVNLLGLPKKRQRAPVVTLQGGRSLVLLLVVVVLIAVMQVFRYGRLQQEDARLSKLIRDQQTEKVRLEGVKVEYEKLVKQKELLAKRTNIIEGLKSKQSGPSRLLTALATTVSNTETLWLTNYEQVGQKVTIEGVALSPKAVADFLTHLKESKAFSEMDLKETFQDSTAKDLQKFLFTVNGQLALQSPTT